MRDYDEVQPSPPGNTAKAASAASTSQSAPRQATAANSRPDLCASSDHQHGTPATNPTPDSQSDGSIDQSPITSGEQEHEPDGHDPDTLMTDAEQPTCGQDLAKRAAEATAVTSPQAHEGEGGPEPIVANDQPAESLGPEDRTGRLSKPDGHTATPLPTAQDPASRCASPNDSASNREDTASAQTSTPTPSSGTTPQDRTTQPPATPSPSSQDGLVQVLNKYMSDPDFDNEVFVPLPGIDPTEIQKGLDVDYTHCQHTGVRFEAGPKGEGYANVFVSKDRCRLDWSKFCSEPVREPTVEEAEEILNRFIDNPPDYSIPYIIGHLKNTPFNEALNPGPAILGDLDLKDLHSEYHHIGLDGSANRFHQEDGTWEDEADGSHHGLCSYNEVYYGYKLWTIVEVHHISKCRNWAQATWNLTKCSQGLSHQCLLIAPATLKRAGIDFKIKVCKPGEAIVTLPGQQHGVVNYGPCASRSINFPGRGGKIQFQKVVYCKEDNMAPVYALHGARRINPPRKALPSAPTKKQPTKRGRGAWADAVPAEKKAKTGQVNGKETPRVTLESLQELVDKFRAENLLCKVPTLRADQLPTERVLRLACAMSSRLAIQQFHSMVQSWNGWPRLREDVPLPGEDPISRIQHRVLLVDKYASMDTLCNYLLRQSQFSLVKEVEAHRQGQMRTDPTFIKQVCERARWTRRNYDYHYRRGKQWIAIRDRNEGILPFLHYYTEPFNISPTQCLNLSEDELSSLASLLDNHVSKALLKAGVAFQQAVEGSRSVRFAWDGHEVDWNSLDENKLTLYLEVVDD
ncbi:hypothetical protein NW754_003465 [Fusarium falciforme]|nr:hypothetical protein NW754_003465 [Fusarium falciforme]